MESQIDLLIADLHGLHKMITMIAYFFFSLSTKNSSSHGFKNTGAESKQRVIL